MPHRECNGEYAVDRTFQPRSGQIKYYEIDICCFPVKLSAYSSKRIDWLTKHEDNVVEWSDMSTTDCCFGELALKNSIESVGLVQSPHHHRIITMSM